MLDARLSLEPLETRSTDSLWRDHKDTSTTTTTMLSVNNANNEGPQFYQWLSTASKSKCQTLWLVYKHSRYGYPWRRSRGIVCTTNPPIHQSTNQPKRRGLVADAVFFMHTLPNHNDSMSPCTKWCHVPSLVFSPVLRASPLMLISILLFLPMVFSF